MVLPGFKTCRAHELASTYHLGYLCTNTLRQQKLMHCPFVSVISGVCRIHMRPKRLGADLKLRATSFKLSGGEGTLPAAGYRGLRLYSLRPNL